jgi:hypothetical protein
LPPETPWTGRHHDPGKVHARNSKQKTNRKLEGNKDPPPGAVQEHPDKVRKVTGKFLVLPPPDMFVACIKSKENIQVHEIHVS